MDAIIMAGGFGSRLGMGEKPTVELLGRPLISYVIDALERTPEVGKIHVAVSPATPNTGSVILNRYNGRVGVINTGGGNYVADMVYAVQDAGITEPVLIMMSDIPLLDPEIIGHIIRKYETCGTPAMSVFSPIWVCKGLGIRPDTVFNWEGKLIVPAGVNILDGKDVEREQAYVSLVLENVELALNVNTVADLEKCKEVLLEKIAGKE
ncbi:MAG: NTP transferase domain-containing protein [Methanolobus sp.]|uniref:NTP transferase domain-containing protein n=1 Tax=Methanolobus sp. TaxID=1874737 RepID=UPI002731CB81|nr:NTP transferase domain-containing protein [Methanolobus sp.]MDP2215693.1 NTP transferase domain-containing protein [Methanolobus sp.]